MSKIRKFTRVAGFNDSTDYVEVLENGSVIAVTTARFRVRLRHFTLDRCLDYVADGSWREITE